MRKSERSTFAGERLVKTTDSRVRLNCADRDNAACRRLDSRRTQMPVDRETRLATHWDHLDALRTTESQFRGRCAATLEYLSLVAVFVIFRVAPGSWTPGKLCFVSSTHQPSPRRKVGRLILQR